MISEASLKQQLTDAYKLCREGRLLELATLSLAQTPLVEQCFLQGVPVNADVRGRTLQSVLYWAALQLQPGGSQSWLDYQWRLYNTVIYFYFERMRVAELAERMAIAEADALSDPWLGDGSDCAHPGTGARHATRSGGS